MDLCFLGCSPDAARLLWIVLVELVPRLLGPSVKTMKSPAAWAHCNTQLNCRTCFTTAIALVSPPFFGFLFGCSSTFQCGNELFSPNLHPVSDLYNWHPGRCRKSQGNPVQVPYLSNTVLLLSTDCKLLVSFQYHLIPCCSKPLPLSHVSHFWRQKFRNRSFWSILLFTNVFNFW